MKVYLDWDEYYPFYSLHDKEQYGRSGEFIELTRKQVAEFEKARQEFVAWQNKIKKLHYKTLGREA